MPILNLLNFQWRTLELPLAFLSLSLPRHMEILIPLIEFHKTMYTVKTNHIPTTETWLNCYRGSQMMTISCTHTHIHGSWGSEVRGHRKANIGNNMISMWRKCSFEIQIEPYSTSKWQKGWQTFGLFWDVAIYSTGSLKRFPILESLSDSGGAATSGAGLSKQVPVPQ